MRIGYDTIGANAARIPRTAAIVGGYDDGEFKWSKEDWELFPDALQLHITVLADPDVPAYDCEPGNGNPQDAVDHASTRRSRGLRSLEYCGLDTWYAEIEQLMAEAGLLSWIGLWVAKYDGVSQLPTLVDVVGKQYSDPGPYDVSIFADYLPGIDPEPEEDTMQLGHYVTCKGAGWMIVSNPGGASALQRFAVDDQADLALFRNSGLYGPCPSPNEITEQQLQAIPVMPGATA